ncbi:MAG: DeoR/GlpR family DNA-binding transcription regulator [Candidatus Pelethousia sp.]|nr:DeoR/GlpR family DNA-binding transcription regulator [Candidatus Pelethousia sp.]
MIARKRLEMIMNLLKKETVVSVKDLSASLGVTEKTIRLDLELLEKANMLRRIHGGAMQLEQPSTAPLTNMGFRNRCLHEKAMIAGKAKSLLKENDVILLDDGSTTLALAKLLGDFRITVLTNDILIVNELMYKTNVSLYVIGGSLKRDGESFVINGEDAIQFIKKYRVNKYFMGLSTIDLENGLMIYYYGDRSTKRAFMAASNQVVCLVDSSKFNHTAFTRIANVDEIHTIITDSKISPEDLVKYRGAGIEVLVAEEAQSAASPSSVLGNMV